MTGITGENATEAARLMTMCRTGALATMTPEGAPYASFVAVASDASGMPLLLLSNLALHTKYLAADPRSSLLLVGTPPVEGDPLVAPRLSLTGTTERAADQESAKRAYLAVHPSAAGYAGFGDFAFYAMAVTGGHLVAGFGRIVDFSADALRKAIARQAG